MGRFLAIFKANLEDFLSEKKKINKTKKLHLVLEDVRNFFFQMVIPKLNILATRGKKSGFLPFFGTFWPFWRTSLLKWKKMNKMKKVRLVYTSLDCGLCFFNSQ